MSELAEVLDAVHAALVDGDLAALPPLTERLLAAEGEVSEAEAHLLRLRLDRNAACLDATARGIRAARRRLAEIRAVAGGTSAYGPDGGRTALAPAHGSLTQRL